MFFKLIKAYVLVSELYILHLGNVSNFTPQVFQLEPCTIVPISRMRATYPVHLTFLNLVTRMLRVLLGDHVKNYAVTASASRHFLLFSERCSQGSLGE